MENKGPLASERKRRMRKALVGIRISLVSSAVELICSLFAEEMSRWRYSQKGFKKGKS